VLIHYYADRGDLQGLESELTAGVDIDLVDSHADTLPDAEEMFFPDFTPIECAIASQVAGVETVEFLLDRGANFDLDEGESQSFYLDLVIRSGNYQKIQFIIDLVVAQPNYFYLDRSIRSRLTKVERPHKDSWNLSTDDYLKDRHPRFGSTNPEAMNLPLWREMVKFGWWAYGVHQLYGVTEEIPDKPTWCFDRFGQSLTLLPDGRSIAIAGEHEDAYDPDFYIYNDVVVYDGNGDFTIYGYPREIFLPTDFHTATLVGEWIYIIGNLGYMGDRRVDETPIYRLNHRTLEIETVTATGEPPGWINEHHAILRDREIHLTGGKILLKRGEKWDAIDNTDRYILDLDRLCWRVDKSAV
jgi:hypothetical protein